MIYLSRQDPIPFIALPEAKPEISVPQFRSPDLRPRTPNHRNLHAQSFEISATNRKSIHTQKPKITKNTTHKSNRSKEQDSKTGNFDCLNFGGKFFTKFESFRSFHGAYALYKRFYRRKQKVGIHHVSLPEVASRRKLFVFLPFS